MSSKAKGKTKSSNKDGGTGGGGGKIKSKKDKSSKKDHGKYTVPRLTELENNLVLRMPEPFAGNLNEALENGGLKDRLQVEFQEDGRKAKVTFDGVTFSSKLVDLPCVVEAWKSFDKKSLWKTGDLCQMLVCRDPEEPSFSTDEEEEDGDGNTATFDYFKRKMNDAKKYQHPHGITPPLKNVRRRRFRKTAKQKYVDAPEIEKEVKRLLRADVSAVDVNFDVINDEQENKPSTGGGDALAKQQREDIAEDLMDDIDVVSGGPGMMMDHLMDESSNMSAGGMTGFESDIDMGGTQPSSFSRDALDTSQQHQPLDHDETGILPDISSSEDEEDEEDESAQASGVALEDLLQQRAEVHQRLREVQSKIQEQEVRVAGAANQFLKQRFESVLNELREEEQGLLKQSTELS